MSECSTSCPYIGRLARLETNHDHILPLITAMNLKIDQVVIGLNRVEVLESKHNNHSEALGRAFERIESIEKQSSDTSKALADLLSQIKGMTRLAVIIWTIMGVSVGYVVSKVL